MSLRDVADVRAVRGHDAVAHRLLRERRVRIATVLCLATITLVTSRPAAADRWYGWKLYPSDVIAGSLLLVGNRTESVEMEILALPVYVFVPAIVHLTEGEDRRALRSLGLRAGLPLGVYVLTMAAALARSDDDPDAELLTVASCVVAGLIDSMLATTSEPEDPERAMFLRFGGSF